MTDTNESDKKFKVYRCGPCGFTYNERDGLAEDDIAPGTRFEELSEDWTCPHCDSPKSEFTPG